MGSNYLTIQNISQKTIEKLENLKKISRYNKKQLVELAILKLKLSTNDLK